MRLALPPPERGRIGGGPLTQGTKSRQYRATAHRRTNGPAFRTPADADLDGRAQAPLGRGARRHGARQDRRAADAEQLRPDGRLRQIFHRSAGDQRLSAHRSVSARRPDDAGEPGPVRRRHRAQRQERRHPPRRQALVHHAELFVVLLHRALRSGARGESARALCGGTIGLVGTYQMSFAMVDYMQKGRFSNSKFVDASDMVDRIKVIKSAEEQDLVKRAAAMQDGAMRAAFAAVEPGMRDRDVAAIAQCYSQRHGSEHGIYLCASMPPGKPAQFSARHYQNRIIQEGDAVALLVEDAGPGGMYTELGRTCVVGRASQEMKDEYAFALEARKFNLGLLKPGAACKDIFAAYNDFMRKNGRPEEKRLHCHGQGYDLVERPLIRNDEPMNIEKDMNIVVHPTYIKGGMLTWYCDNYLIGPNGPGERLHHFPEEITELG